MPVPSTPPQWYDEAKDKLMPTDAGKPVDVYQYYGSNRTNDPSKLADHDVVITTYHVLASDLNARSQAAKAASASQGSNYIPLSSRVRWWRIVLDESHNIKGDTANARACLGLRAHRRWAVTGTPVNTSCDDLSRQLAFVGISPFVREPKAFKELFVDKLSSSSSFPTGMLAVLRRMMMRHSKEQRLLSSSDAGGAQTDGMEAGAAAAAVGPDNLAVGDGVLVEVGFNKWREGRIASIDLSARQPYAVGAEGQESLKHRKRDKLELLSTNAARAALPPLAVGVAVIVWRRDHERWAAGRIKVSPPPDSSEGYEVLLENKKRIQNVARGDLVVRTACARLKPKARYALAPGPVLVGASDGRFCVWSRAELIRDNGDGTCAVLVAGKTNETNASHARIQPITIEGDRVVCSAQPVVGDRVLARVVLDNPSAHRYRWSKLGSLEWRKGYLRSIDDGKWRVHFGTSDSEIIKTDVARAAIVLCAPLAPPGGRKLLELPPKSERCLHIEFTAEERAAYARIEAAVKQRAVDLLANDAYARKNTFALRSLIDAVRMACSGGAIPTAIADPKQPRKGDSADNSDSDDDNGCVDLFVGASLNESKLGVLVRELRTIRDADTTAKTLGEYTCLIPARALPTD